VNCIKNVRVSLEENEMLLRNVVEIPYYLEAAIERERATQRGRVLTSSVWLWKGPLGVRIT
jgi:hypothetical protein